MLALVGKGLTFDSGGISIKPAENMHEMKYDMSGGAGVIAAMYAIGKLKPKLNVIGVIPSSENLPGPRAMKPGDILRAMNGKTIEVINTDAEGRLILADALVLRARTRRDEDRRCGDADRRVRDRARPRGQRRHVQRRGVRERSSSASSATSASATGACRSSTSFDEQIKSDIADLKNTGGRAAGGAETAGAFLKNFVADSPWIHLDIAGTAYLDTESPFQAKGPTGTPVRAFVALAEALSEGAPAVNGQAKRPAAAV